MKPKHSLRSLVFAASALFIQSASAVDFYWDGGTANWSTISAWSTTAAGTTNPGASPASTTTADTFFNITGANASGNTISFAGGDRSAASLTFNTSGTTNFRAGGSSSVTMTLSIGAGGITINSGAGAVTIGQTPGTYGTATVLLAANQQWTNNAANTLTVEGPVTGTSINLTKAGTGQIRLNGANTYSGSTSVTGGQLTIANYSGLTNTSGLTVSGGGTLALAQVGTGGTSNSINKSLSLSGTLSTIGGSSTNTLHQTWAGNTTLAGNSTITNNGNSRFTIDGNIDLGAHTLEYKADGVGSRINGAISGTGSLNKTSAQDLILAGTNNYSGTTTVTAGTLRFVLHKSLYNSDTSKWTAANINVNSGGILAFNVGGADQFTPAQISTLLTNLADSSSATNGMNAGSTFAFNTDTTPNAFTISDVIADSTGVSGGARGLIKQGIGILTLTNANTYTGATSVNGGTLRLENTNTTSQFTLASSSTTLQIAMDSAYAGPLIVSTGGTIVSDRLTAGAGLTHAFSGTSRLGNGTNTNITAGTNVTSGTAAIQLQDVSNNGGTVANFGFNPTTANLIITGSVTMGAGNTGIANFNLAGTGSVNSIGGAISKGTRDTANLIKSGTSTWTLSGAGSDYNGTTTITGGKLSIASTGDINSTSGITIGTAATAAAAEFNYNASTALSPAVSFAAGSTGGILSGNGTITQSVDVTAGNTLAIGNSAGTMNFSGNLTVGGTYLYELTGGGSAADLGDVAGNLTLGGILDLVQLGTYAVNDKFTLFAYDGVLSGLFKDSGGISNILDDTQFTDAGGSWLLNYNDTTAGLNGGVSGSNTYVTITAVPEPNAAALLGALGTLMLLRRRR